MAAAQKKSKLGGIGVSRITAFLERFSSRHLVYVVGALFLADLVVPDMLPFVDEVILGVLTLLLARWRDAPEAPAHDGPAKPPPKNVTPR